ncbi:MAG: hypothetical protein JNK84_02475 [Phreatobacter sp.]|uniref:hypothetical protein n=1 Tax=Phreatobacter sp. TaxID=1966341 RepID=UPI001A3AC7B8|nr:hypothetical protein [Phreatobacter sp.]MBL8567927.1 hypothetical protein [Phreatobacter sp.]
MTDQPKFPETSSQMVPLAPAVSAGSASDVRLEALVRLMARRAAEEDFARAVRREAQTTNKRPPE